MLAPKTAGSIPPLLPVIQHPMVTYIPTNLSANSRPISRACACSGAPPPPDDPNLYWMLSVNISDTTFRVLGSNFFVNHIPPSGNGNPLILPSPHPQVFTHTTNPSFCVRQLPS